MKILLSAYACEPNKGSEPGVGWSWAIEYAKCNEVWVLTRDNNRETIEKYIEKYPEYQNKNLHFVYVGLPPKLTFWKKGRRGMRLFYMLWQQKAVKVAEELNKKINFDFAQHVTFVSYTQPIYMYKLGIPLVWGPVSGGENIPSSVKIKMSGKEKIIENVRSVSQVGVLTFPSIRKTMKIAKVILVATEETKRKIPTKYQNKTLVMPAIGIEKMPNINRKNRHDGKIKIIMAGRLINWKAFDIGIRSFLKISDKYPEIELHILGEGDRKKELETLAADKIGKQIIFEKPIAHDCIYEFYSGFDLFINTTLRDSGCMTMMEAMSVGVPCIAIAAGGPKVLLESFEECKIVPKSYAECVNKVSLLIEDYIENTTEWEAIAERQRQYAAEQLLMAEKVKYIEQIVR